MKLYVIILSLLTLSSHAATWHIDPSVPNSGDGTSWNSPWKTFANVLWSKVKPGDSLELAKGDFLEESIVVGKSGTTTDPITIRLATDPAHHGHVHLRAVTFGTFDNVHLNGALDPAFVPPKSVHDLYQITNNIGLHIQNGTGPGIYMRGSRTNNKVLWVETYRCGEFAGRQVAGIHINGDTRLSEIGYCWVRDQHWGDGINRGSGIQPVQFDDITIHDCIVSRVGNDAMQVGGGGADIYRNLIDGWKAVGSGGHPDCFQTWGSYYRIHHNIVRDFSPGEGYYASLAYAQMSNPVNGNFLLYNNLFINETVPTETGFIFLFDAWWSPGKHNTNSVVTNIFVANNLFNVWKGSAIAHTFHYDSDRARGTNDYYTITNCYFLNNAVIQCNDFINDATGVSLASTNLQPSNIGYGAWMFDYNVVAGPSSLIRYMGDENWPNAEALNAASPYKHNSSTLPIFRSYKTRTAGNDYRLDTADGVLRGMGTNLTAWLPIAPMIATDLDGLYRDPNKPWDIGPYQLDGLESVTGEPDECEQLRLENERLLEKIRILEGMP